MQGGNIKSEQQFFICQFIIIAVLISAIKIATTTLLVFCFYACSTDSANTGTEKPPTIAADTSRKTPPITASAVATPTPEFRKAVAQICKRGYSVAPDTFACCDKQKQSFFSLVYNQSVFSEQQLSVINQATATEVAFFVQGQSAVVQEWTFATVTLARDIENALVSPMKDKTQERFLRSPFTFWRIENSIYHLSAKTENERKLLNALNEILSNELRPHNY